MRTISKEQFKNQFGDDAYNKLDTSAIPKKESFLQETGSDIKQIGSDLMESSNIRADKTGEAISAMNQGEQGLLKTVYQTTGQGAAFGADVIGNVFKGVVKSFLPQQAETAIKEGVKAVATPITELEVVKNVLKKYNSLDPKTKRDIDATMGFVNLATSLVATEQGINTGVSAVKKGTEITSDITKKVIPQIKTGVESGEKVIQKAKRVIAPIAQEAKRLPARIQTNVAQKQVVQETINKLPSKVAREAAQDGIEIADVNTLYNISKTQKPFLKKLATNVKQFAEGKTKTNPIEVVGKPIVNRIKQLESQKGIIGQKLGKVADNLGNVSKQELAPNIFQQLKEVPGLRGLTVSKNTKGRLRLNFKNTVLTTTETASDRDAIQKIFSNSIKSGTGKQKHLLRQELFEILGGKKRSLSNLTDTQEKAFQAIRKGLSDVLENKNDNYKLLSNNYRKVTQPLQDIRSYMKKVVGADEDIQNMSAGLLARRLTGAAKSNPEIRAVLNAMDKATNIPGKTRVSIESLQDFYNILEKYYDIAPKTGFQAQVRQGVERAVGGPIKFLGEQAKSYLGETPAVRQKALEKMLEEILN